MEEINQMEWVSKFSLTTLFTKVTLKMVWFMDKVEQLLREEKSTKATLTAIRWMEKVYSSGQMAESILVNLERAKSMEMVSSCGPMVNTMKVGLLMMSAVARVLFSIQMERNS